MRNGKISLKQLVSVFCQKRQPTRERVVSQTLSRYLKRETTHPYGGISISPKMTLCCAAYAFEMNGSKMNYPCQVPHTKDTLWRNGDSLVWEAFAHFA